jgi:hypothetical protein
MNKHQIDEEEKGKKKEQEGKSVIWIKISKKGREHCRHCRC